MIGNRAWRLTGWLVVLTLPVLVGCQNGAKTDYDALWAQNQELQSELDRTRAALDAAESELSAVRSELQSMPEPAPAGATGFEGIAGVETERGAGFVKVRVPGDVLFDPGKVALKSSAKATLDQIARVLQNDYAAQTVRVEGYTDTDPIRKSSWKDNLELSLQRAAAVHRYLQQRGIDADRMYAAGFGETQPRETKARSRRVEIVVLDQD